MLKWVVSWWVMIHFQLSRYPATLPSSTSSTSTKRESLTTGGGPSPISFPSWETPKTRWVESRPQPRHPKKPGPTTRAPSFWFTRKEKMNSTISSTKRITSSLCSTLLGEFVLLSLIKFLCKSCSLVSLFFCSFADRFRGLIIIVLRTMISFYSLVVVVVVVNVPVHTYTRSQERNFDQTYLKYPFGGLARPHFN